MVDSTFHLEEEGEKTPDRRFERAATSQKFLEVMVVIDKTVVEFHGEQNTEVFILALFNMVGGRRWSCQLFDILYDRLSVV